MRAKSDVFPIAELRHYITAFNGDADVIINIVDGGVLQIDPNDPTLQPSDFKLEVNHIFPRKILADLDCETDANHIGNYRLVVMPIHRRKRAKMPDESTDFFGRRQASLEPSCDAAEQELQPRNILGVS